MSFDKVVDGVVGKNFEMLRGFRGVVRSKVGEEGLFVHAWKLKFWSCHEFWQTYGCLGEKSF